MVLDYIFWIGRVRTHFDLLMHYDEHMETVKLSDIPSYLQLPLSREASVEDVKHTSGEINETQRLSSHKQ